MMGINVRCDSGMDYAGLIADGAKTLETRRTNSLRPWIGQRVGIVRTGRGKAHLVGYAVIGEPVMLDHAAFREAEDRHLVPSGSAYDAQAGETKYCYPMRDAERLNAPTPVTTRGIIARKLED